MHPVSRNVTGDMDNFYILQRNVKTINVTKILTTLCSSSSNFGQGRILQLTGLLLCFQRKGVEVVLHQCQWCC